MWRKLIACCFLATFCFGASSQILLNEGESFSLYFPTLPITGYDPQFQPFPINGLYVYLNSSSFGPGDSVLMQMFESQATGSPVSQYTMFPGGIPLFQNPSGWTDLEGSIRVTALTGSVVLDHLEIFRRVPDPANLRNIVYGISITPVPEPRCAALASVLLAWLGWRGVRNFKRK
jgi:hypothetical protein